MPLQPTVNFLVAGAQKCGTTALASFLAKHEEICFSRKKEVHFFDGPDAHALDWGGAQAHARYAEAFPDWKGEPLVGEATPIYLYLPEIAGRIREYNPAMKLIVVLREPADRAVSQYRHARRHRNERLPLALALRREAVRLRTETDPVPWNSSRHEHSYVDRGHYARQLAIIFEHFPREQVLVRRWEALRWRHDETLRKIYAFLGIAAPDPLPAAETVHASTVRCWAPAWIRRRIARECLASTEELERLLGWDLSAWKAVAEPSTARSGSPT